MLLSMLLLLAYAFRFFYDLLILELWRLFEDDLGLQPSEGGAPLIIISLIFCELF